MKSMGFEVARKFRATFLIALFLSAPAWGSTFSVTPVRVYLGRAQPIGVVTLHNDNAQPVTIQAEPMKWTQQDGTDRYAPTDDLLVSPPIFTIPAHADQIVRMGLRTSPDPQNELAYRLYFQEVPGATPSSFTGVDITLRIGIPVFVRAGSPEKATVAWRARVLKTGELRIEAKNQGGAHVEIERFQASSAQTNLVSVDQPKYLLPGTTASWTFSSVADHGPGPIHIQGLSDEGPFSAEAVLISQ